MAAPKPDSAPTALILAGGRGTRLRPTVPDTPKPLAAINAEPFLALLIRYLSTQGISNIVLCTGHQSRQIEQAVASWQLPQNVTVTMSAETEPLGTAGAIKHAARHITTPQFIVLNGDTFINLDYRQFGDFYAARRAAALIALTPAQNTAASGAITLDREQRVRSFQEKDATAAAPYINAGVYLFSQSILDLIEPGAPASLEHDIMPRLLTAYPQSVYGFPWTGDFVDIGTPSNYHTAQQLLQKYQAPAPS